MPVITGIGGGGSLGAVVQFVDSISTTAVVRFDFHDLEPSMVTKIDLAPPPLRYAKSSTMLVDGDRIQASAYGNRTITITAEFQSADQDSAAAALSALALELNRPTNILKVQIGTHPTFFRTYRSSFSTSMVAWDTTYLENGVQVEAEPFGLGLPQIVAGQTIPLGEFTRISTDPAYVGTDKLPGMCLDVNSVLGDVETPPQLCLKTGFTPPGSFGTLVVGLRRTGTPSLLSTFFPAESWTAGTDTAVAGSHDANMSGAGNNYMHCTFATVSTLTHRVGFLWPPGATVEARGAFRLFARVRASGTGTVTFAADYNGTVLQPAVALTASAFATDAYLVDLGTFTAPAGQDPTYDGFTGLPLPIQPAQLWVSAARTSGSATADIDYIIAVPADDALAVVAFSAVATNTFEVIDGTSDTIYQATTFLDDPAGVVLSPATHSFSGSLPMLSPGKNRLYIVAPVFDPSNVSSDAGLTTYIDVQIRYWPRYLTLATA